MTNPICWTCKKCSYKCAEDCKHCVTIPYRALLIIFPLNLQTITITRMLSSSGEGGSHRSTASQDIEYKNVQIFQDHASPSSEYISQTWAYFCEVHCNSNNIKFYDKLSLHRVSKKTVQNCFCQNFVTFLPILIIFGTKMAKSLKFCDVHSFPTSPNSCHHTNVLNANVPNCYTTLY